MNLTDMSGVHRHYKLSCTLDCAQHYTIYILYTASIHIYFYTQVESDTSGGCNQDQGSLSCGVYQIKKLFWIDCYKPVPGGLTYHRGKFHKYLHSTKPIFIFFRCA